MKASIRLLIWIVIVCLLTVTVAQAAGVVPVLGRAGGGENYGGGGGGSGGGGGGGGGDIGPLIWLLFELVIHYPYIGVPTLVILAVLIYAGAQSANDVHVTRTIRRGNACQSLAAREQALGAIRERDPQFTPEQFLGRVRGAFVKIQEAWSKQNLTDVRPFISDGIRERFQLQFEVQQAEGVRNQMEHVQVLDASIPAAESDSSFDTIHVRIRASADDYTVSLKYGSRVGANATSSQFVEFWSFHRRPGAQTLTRPGSMEGHCPHCAAPLDIVDRAQCPSCGSTVNSGDYDWVLAEITQESEWNVPTPRSIPGVDELRSNDHSFSVQHIEDRTSVMFWRLRSAEFFGKVDYARPVVSPDLADALQSAVEGNDRQFWKVPAVGVVECLRVEQNTEARTDEILVLVRWSGVQCQGDPRGANHVTRAQSIYSDVYVLSRNQGVQTSSERTFSSASCSQCGALIAATEQASCPYCGANLVDGAHDWVLQEIRPFTADLQLSVSGPANNLVVPLQHMHSELSLAVLARIALSDGELDPRERQMLMDLGASRDLSPEQVDAAIAAAQATEVELPVPRSRSQASQWLEQVVQAALADGKITSSEQQLLTKFAQRMQLAPEDVRLAINRQRREAFQRAKSAIRDSRRSTSS